MNINTFLSEISSIKQTKRDLRNFGIVFFCVGLVFSCISYYKHGWESQMLFLFFIGGVFFLFLGFFSPEILKPLHKIWMTLAIVLGYFFSIFILTLLYVLVLIPVGFLLRLLKKDILDLTINNDEKTFWKDYQSDQDNERYTKMY